MRLSLELNIEKFKTSERNELFPLRHPRGLSCRWPVVGTLNHPIATRPPLIVIVQEDSHDEYTPTRKSTHGTSWTTLRFANVITDTKYMQEQFASMCSPGQLSPSAR
jgi:hypothetical protein